MQESEKERVDRITAVVHRLLKGGIPDPMPVEDDPEDEIRQLSEKVNALRDQFKEVQDFIVPLSQGKLDADLPRGNFLASPFKNLQAALNHLTWQTQQIAQGDFSQRVDFMGDFSEAFNRMVLALRETREQMVSEADRYRKLAEIKNHYLNVMAHDIRTPIGAVIGFADILLEGNLGAKEKKYAKIIRRNSDSLLSLINNILDMARIENRKMVIDALPFSVKEMGEDIREMFELRLKKDVEFIPETDPEIPDRLRGDPGRLRQVLINLVGNAVKFTEAGSVRLAMKTEKRTREAATIRFTVSDTGIGIPQKSLSAVFDPFVQAEKGIGARFGGSGLGLAISRELVSLMRGDLSVESRVGKGTAFSFTLTFPVVRERAASGEAGAAKPHPEKPLMHPRRCNILVVDDDPYSLKIFDRILGRQNIRYTLCESGRKALELLIRAAEQKAPYTLAWVDIDMPGMNGIELARMIRSDPRFNRLRIVACTAHAEDIDLEDPSYFSFITTKPITPRALERILSEARASYPTSGSRCDLAGLRVLVADDNAINRFLIRSMAQKMEIEITEAENGQQAVEAAETARPDIILMDKMMPVMDGIEAIRRIRKIHDRATLPIIAFTADDSAEDQAELIAVGANAILKKPVGYDDLADGFCGVLEQRGFPETVTV